MRKISCSVSFNFLSRHQRYLNSWGNKNNNVHNKFHELIYYIPVEIADVLIQCNMHSVLLDKQN